MRSSFAVLAFFVGLIGFAACGEEQGQSGGGRLSVVTSFYPLEFISARVGGEAVAVRNLTPPGAEPHDLEVTPRVVATIGNADLAVFLDGFAPALDEAIEAEAGDAAFDVSDAADLALEPKEGQTEQVEDHAHHTHEEGRGDDDGHAHDNADPHFWLDPLRLGDVADAVAEKLAALDPDNAAGFRNNAATLRDDLEQLHAEYEAGLSSCATDALVTSHAAFAYLADRYDLRQVGIAGLSPDAEPTAAKLAEVADFMRQNEVATVFYETLVDPGVAATIANETGASTAVLDPIEGLADEATGLDYFSIMRSNLAALRGGLGCATPST